MIQGLVVVAQWELKQRVRSRKLVIGWLIWTVVLIAIACSIVALAHQDYTYSTDPSRWAAETGPLIFGLIVLLTMGFSLVIVPSFSASAIVADRESATLATLQATTLRPGQIAGGKLLGSCAVAGAFLAGSIPALGIAVGVGHIGVGRAIVCLLVMYAELILLCAIALGWSAVAARALVSTVLTYVTVFTLTVVTVLLFGFLSSINPTYETNRTWVPSDQAIASYGNQLAIYYRDHPTADSSQPPAPPLDLCSWRTAPYPTAHDHTERFWWLLLVNPFVIVADASPSAPGSNVDPGDDFGTSDPLTLISMAVRDSRLGDTATTDRCFTGTTTVANYDVTANKDGTYTVTTIYGSKAGEQRTTAPVDQSNSPVPPRNISLDTPLWPIGFAVNFVIAAFFFWLAVRRVSVPYGSLPKGQRVA